MAIPDWLSRFFQQPTIRDGSGNDMNSRSNIKFIGASSVADDIPNDQTVITLGSATHSGAGGMGDADFAVTETDGDSYVGAGTPFTLDRTLTLPAGAAPGKTVTWADEGVGTSVLATKNLKVVAADGKNIQRRNVSAALLTLAIGDLGGGGTITWKFNGTFWKALA